MKVSPGIFLKTILLTSVVMVTACVPPRAASVQLPADGVAQVYECRANYEFLVRIEGEVAHLFLPDRTVTLVHQPSADGAKYSRGEVTFWWWDDEATLEIGQEARMTCILNPKRESLK